MASPTLTDYSLNLFDHGSESEEKEFDGLMFEGDNHNYPQTVFVEPSIEEDENSSSKFLNYDFGKVWREAPKLPAAAPGNKIKVREQSTPSKTRRSPSISTNSRHPQLNTRPWSKNAKLKRKHRKSSTRNIKSEKANAFQKPLNYQFTDKEKFQELKATVAKFRRENRLVEALVLSKQVISTIALNEDSWSTVDMRRACYDVVKLSNTLTKQNQKTPEEVEMCLDFLEYALEVLNKTNLNTITEGSDLLSKEERIFLGIGDESDDKLVNTPKFSSKWPESRSNLKIITLNSMASCHRQLGFSERAKAKAKQGLNMISMALSKNQNIDSDAEACTNLILCTLFSSEGKHDEALSYARAAVDTLEKNINREHQLSKQESIHIIESLAIAYFNVGAESEHILQNRKVVRLNAKTTPGQYQQQIYSPYKTEFIARANIKNPSTSDPAPWYHQAYTMARRHPRLFTRETIRSFEKAMKSYKAKYDYNFQEQYLVNDKLVLPDTNAITEGESKERIESRFARALHTLKEENMHRIIDVFTSLDLNNDGVLDLREITLACRRLGIKTKKRVMTKLIQKISQKGSLKISYDEFLKFMQKNGSQPATSSKNIESVSEADIYDWDGIREGNIDQDELMTRLEMLDSFSFDIEPVDALLNVRPATKSEKSRENDSSCWYRKSNNQDKAIKEFIRGPVPMVVSGWRAIKPDAIKECIREDGKIVHWPPLIRGDEVNALLVPKLKPGSGSASNSKTWGDALGKILFTNLRKDIQRKGKQISSNKELAQEVLKGELDADLDFGAKLETLRHYLQ